MDARDIAIRTILGEAANESPMGQAAVAHVLLNRARDPRWPSQIQDVALQPKQFSAWNEGAGGNHLVNKYGAGDDPYERVGRIYDSVMSGQIADPTDGATHYYSPAGMSALVNEGSQSNLLPRWLQQENERRGGQTATIGGHIFTGLADGSELPPQTVSGPAGMPVQASPQATPEAVQAAFPGIKIPEPQAQSLYNTLSQGQAFAPPQMPPLSRPQFAPIEAVNRNTLAPYLGLFEQLRG